MLKFSLLHPQILSSLGKAGHGSKILIADGNYPFSTRLGPKADLVCLNLRPGLVSVTDVLETIVTAVQIESAAVMEPSKTGPYAVKKDPDIFKNFVEIISQQNPSAPPMKLQRVDRLKFYEQASSPDVCLTIATAEQRIFGNLLLTIGVVRTVN